jgi:hypothetical protein
VRLPDCRHAWCRACISELAATQVRDGAVDSIRCPATDCRKALGPAVLQALLPQVC